jgi:hypothetical protein
VLNSKRAIAQLSDLNPDAVLLENMDAAIIGIGCIGNNEPVAVYSRTLIYAELMQSGFSSDEINDYYINSFMGVVPNENTPVIVDDLQES